MCGNMKKASAFLLALSLLLASSACGAKTGGASSPASQAPEPAGSAAADAGGDSQPESGGAVEIVYAAGQDTTGASQEVVEKFNALHEGEIKVKFIELPADTGKQHDLYVTAFASGGSEYDVFNGDCIWPSEFSNAGYVLALDKFIQRDGIDLDGYMQGPVQAATFKGKLWALPRYIDTGMLFYRTDLVEKAPETWEEFMEMARAAKAAGAEMGYATQAKQYEGLVCNAMEFIAAYGGQVVDGDGQVTINSPETIKGLTVMRDLLTDPDIVPSNITTFQEGETEVAFNEGRAAFARNWSYMWATSQAEGSKVAGKVAIAPLPAGDAGSASCLGGWMSMINKNTLHSEEAWEFLKYIAGPEGQKSMAIKGGQTPTLLSMYEDPEVLKHNPFYGDKNFVESMKVAAPRPVSPVYTRLSEIMQIELAKVLSGQSTVEEAVAAMETQMKEAVASVG